jgi:hypothetical protein
MLGLSIQNDAKSDLTVMGVFVRLVAAVLLGAFVTFALTVVGETAAMSLRDEGTRLPYFETAVALPLIALIVGSLIGLIAQKKAPLAAILGLAPWVVYMLVETGRGHMALSWWTILIALASIYFGLGIGAAVFVSRRMNRSVVPNSR